MNFDFKQLNNSYKEFINETLDKYSNNSKENCRVYVRPSGTEPFLRVLVEAQNKKEADYISRKLITELRIKFIKYLTIYKSNFCVNTFINIKLI